MKLSELVTIVIPCRNEQDYIGHLLDDISQQRGGIQDVRIIVADLSDDRTPEVIQEATDRTGLNVEVVPGGPVSEAKNRGAALATTPYILFIDSDVRFFDRYVIWDTLMTMRLRDLDLLGLRIRCYDSDIRAQIGFTLFNLVNQIMSRWVPFAVGAYMLTRADRFRELGGFPCRYPTSEDFFLSKQYDPRKFHIDDHYFGQDSRRFRKMGYLGMLKYLLLNFWNRNNPDYWERKDFSKYWD